MKIVTLRAENVKRLKAVEITPDGDVVVVAGRNAQGKSSVLDAIWMALAGADGAKETTRPIRDGEERASVQLDLGDLIVTREWTQAGTTLKVTAADGARYSSPQTMLDGLIGRLTFDPLAFANQSPKEQLATLLSVVELPFDAEELARRRAGAYEQRTDVNRELKRIEAALSELPAVPDDTPDEEMDAARITAELAAGMEQNQRRHQQEEAYRRAGELVEQRERELEEAQRVLAAARQAQADIGRQATVELVDVQQLRDDLEATTTVNAHVRIKQQRTKLAQALQAHKDEAEQLTLRIAAIDQEKADAIAAAQMPLAGLSFDEEGVLYQGVPFSQASDSERLRVGIAVAMALNPTIRVLRITDGSLLDSENLALVGEMAAEHDFQVWIERVDESGELGIVIEDGAVKPKRQRAQAAAA